ncbi:Plug domain-containing protein, partial [Halomonas sp. SIMBA_159]
GQPGRGAISARGVSQQNDSAVTAIYLDDVPMTSNTGFAAGGRLFFDGLLGDVARVELIKGPQGTLFGATAIAGAVRYISNAP